MKSGGIYEIANTTDGRRYIGSTVNFGRRWKTHREQLTRGVHHSILLQRAWDKYGQEAFVFSPVMLCSEGALLEWEQKYLDEFAPEYNICKLAGSSLGIKFSKEVRERMSERVKARAILQGGYANLPRKGDKRGPHSFEHRAKISAALTGRRGTILSLETRNKMSVSHTGKKRSAAQRANMSLAQIGNKNSLGKIRGPLPSDVREKISLSLRGKPWSSARRAAYGRVVP